MTNTALTKPTEERAVEFIPFGAADKIKLSVAIVQKLVCTPTRSGKVCDERQAMKFVMLCQAQRLNPFAGDAYLIGFDGKDGPQFSLVTAHQAFLKRAEVCEDYDGMESGVILKRKEDGELSEQQGDFYDESEHDLVGGWARVHHKKRKVPTYRRAALKSYQKPYGLWADVNQRAMMITKVAEADALRSTFPTMLGGLYNEGEQPVIDITPTVGKLDMPSRATVIPAEAPQQEQPLPPKGSEGEAIPDGKLLMTPQQQLAAVIVMEGLSFDDWQKWAAVEHPAMDAGSKASFDELTIQQAKQLLRVKDAMIEGMKGGAA